VLQFEIDNFKEKNWDDYIKENIVLKVIKYIIKKKISNLNQTHNNLIKKIKNTNQIFIH
jgi:hypothetical protein